MIAYVEQQRLARGRARCRWKFPFRRSAEQGSTHIAPPDATAAARERGQRRSLYAAELTGARTKKVSRGLSFLGKEIRHRQVAFARVVIERQDPRPLAEFRQLLLDTGESGAGRDADQQPFLARGATR